jgi:superfamily II DNA or RNA helicase
MVHANSMHVVPVAPDIDPALVLTDGAIRATFPPSTLEAGRIYELRGRVRNLRISNQGALIVAETQGTAPDPYRQRIAVGRGRNGGVGINGVCSCPVGRDCKHVAAVLVAAHREELAGGGTDVPPMTTSRPDTSADPLLPYDLAGWLSTLQTDDAHESEDYPAGMHQRLHYVLSTVQAPRGAPTLVMRPFTVRLLATGKISHPKQFVLHQTGAQPKYLRPSDRIILARLRRAAADQMNRSTDEDPEDTLRRVIATGRAFWGSADGPRVTEGKPQTGSVVWKVAQDGTQQTGLALEEGLLPLDATMLWYVEPRSGVVGPIALDLPARAAARLLRAPPVPPELAERVTAELRQRMPSLPVPVPRTLPAAEPIGGEARPFLRLINGTLPVDPGHGRGSARHVGGGLYEVPLARLAFRYGPITVPSTIRPSPRRVSFDGKLFDLARDKAGEQKALETLALLGLGRVAQLAPVYYQHAHTDDFALNEAAAEGSWLAIVLQIVPDLRTEGWDVEIDDDFPVHVVTPDSDLSAELEETAGIDWLELHVGVRVGGEVVDLVPALVRLITESDPTLVLDGEDDRPFLLPLSDGRLLSLPLGRIRPTLRALMELYTAGGMSVDGEKIGFSRLDAANLAELEERAGLELKGGETLRALGRQLRDAGGTIPEAIIPDTFHGSLREYQARGVDWLQFLRGAALGGILADDMGLGKTIQTLAHLLIEQKEGRLNEPALIVCPTSLIPNWSMEAEKFAPSLRVLALHGPGRKERFREIKDHDLVLTTYPLLARDHEVLVARDWHAVILDEAQTIKNPNAETTRQALRLKAGQRLCLSGTPLQNHLGELWSLFDFLAPGFLGSQRGFRARYRNPIEKHGDPERQSMLNKRVRPFMLRRTKQEVATELPPKTEIFDVVEMEQAQRAIYDGIRLAMHSRVRAAIADKGLARSGIIILDALLKMRQACCDPRLLKLKAVEKAKAGSAKLDRLAEMLPIMISEGRRILLFSQFTEMLGLIEQRLWDEKIEYVMLTGDTKDRRTPVKTFQAGKVPVFLISLKAGGVGLNLTAADTVIHYDPWWNPAAEDQATDRAHRIGQDKKVFVHRLVTLGTIEEKMEELKQKKRALVAAVMEAEGGGPLKLTTADIEALFAPDGHPVSQERVTA